MSVEQREVPNDLSNFKEWCDKHLAGYVDIHNRALRGIKKSRYKDVPVIFKALLLLRDYYVPIRRKEIDETMDLFTEECRKQGISLENTFRGTRHGEHGKTYFINHEGEERLLDLHLKKGNSRNEKSCFRAYFFWDKKSRKAVVGWLPSHLPTRIT